MMKKLTGFTLIELLVAIGIIAILAAILVPVVFAAKEKGKMAACLSNLHQLGKGMTLYADEWNHYPIARLETGGYGNPSGNWAGVYDVFDKCDPRLGQIFQYVRNTDVYLCPSDKGVCATRITQADSMHYPLSYSMNNIADYRSASNMSVSASKVGLIVHEDRDSIDDGDFYWVGWEDGGEGANRPGRMHNGGTCVLFCDQHALWQKYETVITELRSGAWDPLNVRRNQ
ncbi:DUF1559 domain-containing protein [bacterium]|nr:DUF1559 domain-containing protein [bacterium]